MIIAQYTECPSPLFFLPQVKPSSIKNIFISGKKNFHTNHQFGIGQDIKTHYKNIFAQWTRVQPCDASTVVCYHLALYTISTFARYNNNKTHCFMLRTELCCAFVQM